MIVPVAQNGRLLAVPLAGVTFQWQAHCSTVLWVNCLERFDIVHGGSGTWMSVHFKTFFCSGVQHTRLLLQETVSLQHPEGNPLASNPLLHGMACQSHHAYTSSNSR
jgi:hypothetical protein